MRTVDLFCGCGGVSLGFINAGFDVVAAFDYWDEAIEVYKANFMHSVLKQNLMDINTAVEMVGKYKPEMIIGGPPCQDFSSAGKRNEDNGRGNLTVAFAHIVSAVHPKWFVMENVARITKTKKLIDARAVFKAAGYGLTQVVLDASLCGVPQKRKRFFMIGKLDESDDFIIPEMIENLAYKPMSVADYFGGSLDIKYYYRHPRSYVRRGIFSVDEPSPTIRGVNRPMPKGYELRPNDPVTSKVGIRSLTTEERSLIQTFPRDFVFLGSKTAREQMIGNAVPVNLAKYVGNAITRYMNRMNKMMQGRYQFVSRGDEDKYFPFASERSCAE